MKIIAKYKDYYDYYTKGMPFKCYKTKIVEECFRFNEIHSYRYQKVKL